MKLLLDEMYSSAIAEELRGRGHDVSAVTERPELPSLPDADVFLAAQEEQRSLVTENIGDFSSIADDFDRQGRVHYGLVLIDPATYPRGKEATIGRLVVGLDQLVKEHPIDAATSRRHWLSGTNPDEP